MNNSMLNNLLFDPAYLIIGLAVISIALLIAFIICAVKMNKLYHKYDSFMRGKDAESLEDIILSQIEDIKELKSEDRGIKDSIKVINRTLGKTVQKMGISEYDAFQGMGGQASFALAMLDKENDGMILNCMHSREGCYLYIKEVKGGESEIMLGEEEKKALSHAMQR